jgi:uncharacterized protein
MARRVRWWAVVAAVLSIAAIAGGCGGGGKSGAAKSTSTAGTTTSPAAVNLSKLPPAQKGKKSVVAHYRPGSYRTMVQFLTLALNRVDAYWTKVFANSGIAAPTVMYNWLKPGGSAQPKCTGGMTNDSTAAYCSADDTIYISQQMATNLWKGFLGNKTAKVYPGAFGLAFVVAHEYGHNVQAELGIGVTKTTVSQLELQADCLAGNWANSEYYAGVLDAGDVQRALALADLVGDYDFTDRNHHGTPAERTAAWKVGYNSGQPDRCRSTYSP